MNALSIVVGALCAAVAVFVTDQLLMQRGSGFIALEWAGMPLFLAIAASSAWLGRIAILLMLVLAWRPRTAINWVRPAQCASLRDWCSRSWDVRTPSSSQTGHRVFGLNLSLQGGMPQLNKVATPERSTQSI